MADFILLEPSCDINFVLPSNFRRNPSTILNNLKLRVFKADQNGLRHDLDVVTDNLESDFIDPTASAQSQVRGMFSSIINQNRIEQVIVEHFLGPGACGRGSYAPKRSGGASLSEGADYPHPEPSGPAVGGPGF